MADDWRLDEMRWTAAERFDVRLVKNEFCLQWATGCRLLCCGVQRLRIGPSKRDRRQLAPGGREKSTDTEEREYEREKEHTPYAHPQRNQAEANLEYDTVR